MATMASPSSLKSVPGTDDRREWIRIDDRVLMEYRLVTDDPSVSRREAGDATPESIAAVVSKPTADLLARSSDALSGAPILPWIMKIDYLLEVILNALAAIQPSSVVMAKPTDVNLSGGGVGFVSAREFSANDQLALKLILPPFVQIQAIAKVIRSLPLATGEGFTIATEFTELKADDQEHLIRHILQTQAERLRARRTQTA